MIEINTSKLRDFDKRIVDKISKAAKEITLSNDRMI